MVEKVMLTPERLSEVSWALGKITDAERAVDKLLEGEESGQPPTERRVTMTKISNQLADLRELLEGLYS